MKINLLFNNTNDMIEGYINLDLTKLDKPLDKTLLEAADLNECDEIVAHDIIRYYRSQNDIISLLSRFVSLGGKLVLIFYEFDETVRAYQEGRLSLQELQNILYGQIGEVNCTPTLEQVSEIVEQLGFKISRKKINNITALIVAERPNG